MAKASTGGEGSGAKRAAKGKASRPAASAHKVPPMSDAQIDRALAERSEWARVGDAIQRTLSFKDFVAAMVFVGLVAEMAESDQHHPDILIRYNKVTLSMSTHDAGGISHKDFALAAKVDGLATS